MNQNHFGMQFGWNFGGNPVAQAPNQNQEQSSRRKVRRFQEAFGDIQQEMSSQVGCMKRLRISSPEKEEEYDVPTSESFSAGQYSDQQLPTQAYSSNMSPPAHQSQLPDILEFSQSFEEGAGEAANYSEVNQYLRRAQEESRRKREELRRAQELQRGEELQRQMEMLERERRMVEINYGQINQILRRAQFNH